jgi:ketosteroid isomerase-like protein
VIEAPIRCDVIIREEETMGEAREVMDRLTAAASETRDFKAVAECYAEHAVAVDP